jgi:hypothetical protein
MEYSINLKDIGNLYDKVIVEGEQVLFDRRIIKKRPDEKGVLYRDILDVIKLYGEDLPFFKHPDIEFRTKRIAYDSTCMYEGRVSFPFLELIQCMGCKKFSNPESIIKHFDVSETVIPITEVYLVTNNETDRFPLQSVRNIDAWVGWCKKCETRIPKEYCCVHCCPFTNEHRS